MKRMNKVVGLFRQVLFTHGAGLLSVFALGSALGAQPSPRMYNVIWDSPSKDQHGSMPLGNGDIGLNVWALADGTLHLLISKTDAWDDNARLVKVGEVVLRFDPKVFAAPFRQELDLATGSILLQEKICVWVDAHHPVIHVSTDLPATAGVALWRTNRQQIATLEGSDIMNRAPAHLRQPIVVEPDTLIAGQEGQTTWYHHNVKSVGPEITAKTQGLTGYQQADPLLHRTFGGRVVPTKQGFDIYILTKHPSSPGEWLTAMDALVGRSGAPDFKEHKQWWLEFWNRSWICAINNSSSPAGFSAVIPANTHPLKAGRDQGGTNASSDEAAYLSQMYALQRFITACAGRGRYPIKFNGSLFTVSPGKGLDHDYRRWGPGYWWQNTRLPYLYMCTAGDTEMMKPLFRMYAEELLPLCKYRTRLYCGHEGAFFPECMYFWGTIFNGTYGWTPFEQRKDKLQESGWHKWEWVGGLELCWMMLDYYDHTLDRDFLTATALPFCHEILTFFDQHYKTGADGKLVMHPSQALETWWSCTNAMPELAGSIAVSERLLVLSGTAADDQAFWRRFREKLPNLPLREVEGKKALAPAAYYANKHNFENPELYAVFPFRLIAVGKPNIEWGVEALRHRWDRCDFGWGQTDIFQAYLGLAEEAAVTLVKRARNYDKRERFPAFWGPNFDWTPDQDHGGVLAKGFQSLLVQSDGPKIYLLPAWPRGWDCDFKVHAPGRTVITGRVEKGKLADWDITPAARRADVVLPPG